MYRLVTFINELAAIFYVGGIASHIVMGAVVGSPDAETAYTVYTYKELSAYILILPGLAAKVICDLVLYFVYNERGNWMKVKAVLMAFLTINAFVFLVPMMPELRALALAGDMDAFHALEGREAMVGASNAIPLALELILGHFKPKLFRERRPAA
ncbi:enoyl-CoA hydratase [Octadecabacter sp. 1_MG-2023]|uniref:enoyl-CoA hydratase n=1 Tax=unclassified Octadecabacter TaxID=196158 RepID=UPI001C08D07E|nr:MULTISPECIES: enoyl-CoA hydratase [unclassified Octadecabacter]MBU2992421.1 enoyl-CoA hydratase [Octadecabacter sp. B2R22]MDO6734822.1 enoyl-CoA hydratase [Octadecabacter sp. 1_MG-2023]